DPDPGTWAAGTVVTLSPSFEAKVAQGQSIAKDGTTLERLAGFTVGDTVVLSDGPHRAAVTITELTSGTGAIKWTPDLGNAGDFDATKAVVVSTDFDLAITRAGDAQPAETWARL